MKKLTKIAAVSVLALIVAGCETMNNQTGGTLAGAAVGGLLGNSIGGGSGRALATFGGRFSADF